MTEDEMVGITDSKDMNLGTFREMVKDRKIFYRAMQVHKCRSGV